jgi:hypothetical protein
MKFRLHANAEVDMLTKKELKDELNEHAKKLTGGIRYRRMEQQFTGTGPITFQFFVPVGFIWSVRGVSVQKPTADVAQVWLNSINPMSFVNTIADDTKNGNFATYEEGALTVQAGGTVIVQCPVATGIGYAAISVAEVLVGEEWRL